MNLESTPQELFRTADAVFFDAGFTLLEPTVSVDAVYCNSAAEVGAELDAAAFRTVLAEKWRRLNHDYRSRYPDLESSEELEQFAWLDFTRSVAESFPNLLERHAVWHERLLAHFDSPEAWKLTPGTEELLDALARRGALVGVVSNWHGVLHQILEGHGLTKRLSFVLTSAEAGRKKPHRAIFEKALALSGSAPDRTVHIGDSFEDDVEGAQAAGIRPILVRRSSTNVPTGSSAAEIRCLRDLL